MCTNGHSPLSRVATMPIYDKKNLILQNQESFESEPEYIIGNSRASMFVQMMIVS